MSEKKFVDEVKIQIVRRDYIKISPFLDLVQKTVRFEDKEELDLYHGVRGQDYVCILTKTDDGRIPLVRQYRPMVERYTWELPAGTLEVGESPGQCAIRELYEETGYKGIKLTNLGTLAADTGRLDLLSHGFYIHPVTKDFEWESEYGVDMHLFSESELFDLVRKGDFIHSMHIGWLGMMMLLGNSSLHLGCD